MLNECNGCEYKCSLSHIDICTLGSPCPHQRSTPMTNEEWFCTLSTEEKAEFLAKKCGEISCKFFLGEAEEIFSRYWVEWLKKPYQRGDTE